MGEKKRKRQSQEGNGASKRVAITGKDTIHVSYTDSSSISPILLSSPGLTVPKLQYKTYAKPRATNTLNVPIRPSTHNVILQSSDHPKLDYTAATSTLDPSTTHYLGIFDPTTKKLTLTPAHHLALRSTLRSEVEEVEREKRTTYAEQRDNLGREFGTRKMRKAIASRTDNAITQSPTKPGAAGGADGVQRAILDTVADAVAADPAVVGDPAAALLASKPMPMPNLRAANVEEVYPLSALVPAADRHHIPLKHWQDSYRAGEDVLFNHRVPACRLKGLITAGDVDMEKLIALGYISLLLEFHDTLTGTRTKKVPKKEVLSAKLAEWPSTLVESVRRRFTDDSGSHLGKWQLDNLYTHMAALNLFVDNWVTDISNLRDDLKLENKEMGRYFMELGCKISNMTEAERIARQLNKQQAAAAKMAKLRLPLDFPKASRRRR